MAFTTTWNANFEALPPDTGENIAQGANRMRALKNAIRERLATDHYFEIAGTDADHGEHIQIKFHGNLATPANVANKGTLYPQLANAKLELFYKNNSNQIVQITSNGAIAVSTIIPAGTKMLIYADTAPSGWTIVNTMDDKLVFVTKGNAAGGQTGGNAHANGTWTISGLSANHLHGAGTLVANAHIHVLGRNAIGANAIGGSGGFITPSSNYMTHGSTGGSDPALYDYTGAANANGVGGNTANTNAAVASSAAWRPAAYCFIVCNKS